MKAPKPKRVRQARGDVWRHEYRDAGGQHTSITIGRCEELSEQQACAALWKELEARKRPAVPNLEEFIWSTWLPPRMRRWPKSTKQTMLSAIRSHILRSPLAGMPIDTIRKADVDAWSGLFQDRGIAHNSAKQALGALRSIFEEAADNEWIGRNPARNAKLPALRKPVDTVPFRVSEVALLAAIPAEEGLILRTMIFCGLRIGELLALQVSDLQHAELIVDENIGAGGRGPTKNRRPRIQPLPPGLAADLAKWTAGRAPGESLFPGWRNDEELNEHLRAHAQAAGVAAFTSRRCRPTYGTLLELPVDDVRQLLDHSDERITLRHYRRPVPERQAKAVADFEALIGRAKTGAKTKEKSKRFSKAG